MLGPPLGKALPSGSSGLTAHLDLFWSIHMLLWFEQFLFLSLFSVKKIVSEWCQLVVKQEVGRAAPCTERDKGRGSSVHPLQPSINVGTGNIPYSFSCCFCLFLLTPSPGSFPQQIQFRPLPPQVRGQAAAQLKALSCTLRFSHRPFPFSFPLFLIVTMYCNIGLSLDLFFYLNFWVLAIVSVKYRSLTTYYASLD